MATFKEGVNGPFKGKVGSVIGSRWRAIPYMKGMYKVKRNKSNPSEKQAAQHQKFRLLNRFFMPIGPVLDIGFRALTSRATAKNVAFSYNYDHAFVEENGQITLNYPALKFSHGSLYTAGAEKTIRTPDGVKVVWNPKTYGVGGAMDDIAYAIAYSVSLDMLLCETARRHDGEAFISFAEAVGADELHVWLFFADSRGKQASRTEYIPLTDTEP